MKQFSVILAAILLLTASCNKETKTIQSDLEVKVDSLVLPLVDSSDVAGVVVAIYKGNERKLLKSYGYADLDFDIKMTTDASLQIGSVTKQFTGVAVMQLVQEGKLNLDDDITKYLKFNTQGRKITVRQLLSHTSGLKGYTELPFYTDDLVVKEYERDTLLRLMEKESLNFEPGERLIYSNTGFFFLGLIIEKVSGQSYEEYVQKNLFAKAGMSNSYYANDQKVIKKRAQGYQVGKNGLEHAFQINQTWPYAAGSLSSTAEDLIKWNNALHQGKILNEQTYKEFITPASLNDGTLTRYAKGITAQIENGRKLIAHGGSISGFLAELRYYPSEDISIIVLFNTSGPTRPADTATKIAEVVFGKPTKSTEPKFEGDLSKYAGTFTGKGRGRDAVAKITAGDSTITISINGDKPRSLTFSGNNTWVSGISNYQFINHDGDFDELRIDQVYGYLILKRSKQ